MLAISQNNKCWLLQVRVDISFHYDGVPDTPEPVVEPEEVQPVVEQASNTRGYNVICFHLED